MTELMDIVIDCAGDFGMSFTLRDEEGDLIDLTGAVVTAQLREFPESLDHFDFSCSHNGQGGQVVIGMSWRVTAKIPYTRGVYDVFVDFPNDTRKKYLKGKVEIYHNVTEPREDEADNP